MQQMVFDKVLLTLNVCLFKSNNFVFTETFLKNDTLI